MEKQFLEAYEKYADAIFRYCYFKVSDRDLALDLMQETFKHAWEYLVAGKKVQNVRAFLYRIANNLVVDEYRKKKSISLEAIVASGMQFEQRNWQDPGKVVDAQDVFYRIGKLEPAYREAVFLRYVQELSLKEIAEILGERENTISVRIHRGLQQLRQILAKEYESRTKSQV